MEGSKISLFKYFLNLEVCSFLLFLFPQLSCSERFLISVLSLYHIFALQSEVADILKSEKDFSRKESLPNCN